MALANSRMLIHKILNKNTDIVSEAAPLIILDSNSDGCMAKNDSDINHTRHVSRRVHFVRNGEKVIITILTGVKEVCNCHTLQLRIF